MDGDPSNSVSNDKLVQIILNELQDAEASTRRALSAVLEEVKAAVSADESSILVPDSQENLRFHLSTNARLLDDDIPFIPIDDSIAGIAMLTGQAIAVDEPKFGEIDAKTGTQTETYIATPIVVKDDIMGVLTLVNRVGTDEPFNQQDINEADRFADTCGYLLDHAIRLSEQTQKTVEGIKSQLGVATTSGDLDEGMPMFQNTQEDPSERRADLTELLETIDDNDIELLIRLLNRLSSDEVSLNF